MSVNLFQSAASAYSKSASLGSNSTPSSAASKNGGSTDFFGLVANGVENSINTVRAGEFTANQGLMKKADITDVVNAVTNAEATLRTVVTIRDRMVSAMQEVLRMPI